MREIKFRAWDKTLNEMRQVQLMDWSDWWVSTAHTWERINSLGYGDRNSFKNEETDRHFLMQYTGLKDKNGKEIYESDILNVIDTDNGYYDDNENWIPDVEYKTVVKYGDGAFFIEVGEVAEYDVTAIGWALGYEIEVEVIGNIYENPELLEVSR